jgi:hypothetical protein
LPVRPATRNLSTAAENPYMRGMMTKVSKKFFFEKKNQKTFVYLGGCRFHLPVLPAHAGIHAFSARKTLA